MTIEILGAATVGMTLATKFAAVGHDVLIANSRGPQSLAAPLAEAGISAKPASVSEVLACDVVFLATPWLNVPEVLRPGIAWDGRILVDTTNIFLSYAPDYRIDDLKGDSGSEIVARLAPSARVVKAFNTLPFKVVFAPAPPNQRRVLFVAGDEGEAVSTVSALIREIGLHPVALGRLAVAGRQMELGGPLSLLEVLAPGEGRGVVVVSVAPISMYDASIEAFRGGFRSLSGLIDKAEEFVASEAIMEAALLDARLADDMDSFRRQIQHASDAAKACAMRLAGCSVPRLEDDERSLQELRERVVKTLDILAQVSRDDLAGCEDRIIKLNLRRRWLSFDGHSYLLEYALPNFFFHVTTAYAILRHQGLKIGKLDYLVDVAHRRESLPRRAGAGASNPTTDQAN